MVHDDGVMPKRWWEPRSEKQQLCGHRCRECGHKLEPFTALYLAGPWEPATVEAALTGRLNLITCGVCKSSYPFEVPLLICSLDRNRLIVVMDRGFIIPERRAIEEMLDALLLRRTGPSSPLLGLPKQSTSHVKFIPGLLEVPDEYVYLEEAAVYERQVRLALSPRSKAWTLRRQFINLAYLEAQRARSFTAEQEEPVPRCELGFIHIATPFESTRAGHSAIRKAFQVVDADSWVIQSNLTGQALASLCRHAPTDIPKDRRYHGKLTKRFLANIDQIHLLGAVEPTVRKAVWLNALHELFACDHPALALDLGEAYIAQISLDSMDIYDVEAMVLFGALLQRAGGDFNGEVALPYLMVGVRALDKERSKGNEKVAFVAAFSREIAALELQRTGELSDALQYYLEALGLYEAAESAKGLASVVGKAIPLAAALRDERALTILRAFEENMAESADPVIQLDQLWSALDSIKSGDSATPRVRTAIYNLIDNPASPWPPDELRITLKPINFDANDAKTMPPDPTLDVELTRAYRPADWMRLRRSRTRFPSDVLIGRVIQLTDTSGHIAVEEIIQHPMLDWARSGSDPADQRTRLESAERELLNWAAVEGYFVWLASQVVRYDKTHGSDPEAWPQPLRFSLGRALGSAAVSEKHQNDKSRGWFADTSIRLLATALGPAASHASVIPQELTPQAVFMTRSALARCYELVGKLEEAWQTYEINVWQAFRVRHFASDLAARKAIQELIGPESSRLNRVRLRLEDSPPPQTVRDLFETVEMTRARVLADAIEITSSRESATSPRNLKWHAAQYVQLSIVQSTNDYSGCWLAIREAAGSSIVLRRIEWDEPLSCHEELESVFLNARALSSGESGGAIAAVECIRRMVRWMERESFFLSPARSTSLRVFTYWIFLGRSAESSAHISTHQGLQAPSPDVPLIAAFSRATAISGEEAALTPLQPEKVGLFLDPLGDLPEVALIASPMEAALVPRVQSFQASSGLAASTANFLAAARDADLLGFIGHGSHASDHRNTQLVFSLGRRLGQEDFAPSPGITRRGPRLAIILACWGGQSDIVHSLSSWEPDGLVYALKGIGFDFVISALWPISPRLASAFMQSFLLDAVSGNMTVVQAFVNAYDSVIRHFGVERTVVEGPCIQLYVQAARSQTRVR